jgi:hypothetical protein
MDLRPEVARYTTAGRMRVAGMASPQLVRWSRHSGPRQERTSVSPRGGDGRTATSWPRRRPSARPPGRLGGEATRRQCRPNGDVVSEAAATSRTAEPDDDDGRARRPRGVATRARALGRPGRRRRRGRGGERRRPHAISVPSRRDARALPPLAGSDASCGSSGAFASCAVGGEDR